MVTTVQSKVLCGTESKKYPLLGWMERGGSRKGGLLKFVQALFEAMRWDFRHSSRVRILRRASILEEG